MGRGRRKIERPRVLGPSWLSRRQRWRVRVIVPETTGRLGGTRDHLFIRKHEAEDFIESALRQLARFGSTTIAQAIDGYAQHLKDKGTIGFNETVRRLRLFFPDLTLQVGRVTVDRGKKYYEAFRQRARSDGRPISVAYHRATLINARSLFSWCIDQGLLAGNPLEGVKGIGKKNRGKVQHTGDEVRRLYAHCLALAEQGNPSALGVLAALLMALRSSDLTRRVVRDVDLDATVLRVERGKTAKSNRPRRIPEVLRPMFRALVVDRDPLEPLFKTPYTDSGHHTRRWLEEAMRRFCARAGVPYACPHALKGTAATLLAETGELADKIADHLSHESSSTTKEHYVEPATIEEAKVERALVVIAGGKR